MLVATHHDRSMAQRLAEELAEVECRFAAQLTSDLPCVNDLVTHIERYRGKMLRPTLVLACGLASRPGAALTDAHRVVATVAEMVHMATLVHDDVLDEAQTRRRGATINHLCGNETAVMLGDYLISHSFYLCSSLNNPQVNQNIANATNSVCEGELLQLANRNHWALDEATYFEIIRRKTASLCAACCRLGGLLHDPHCPFADELYDFGEKVGIAFQIVDDVLDLMGSEDTVGKTLGRDLQKGKLTLPVIHYLATARPKERQALLDLVQVASAADTPARLDPQRMAQVREVLAGSAAVGYARAAAGRLVRQAQGALEAVPASPVRALLGEVAQELLTRKF